MASGSLFASTLQKRVSRFSVEREVEHDVERRACPARRRGRSTLRPTRSGRGGALRDRKGVEVGREAAAALQLGVAHARRHAGSRYAAMRSASGRSISSLNASRMLNVNGSRRFIWNTSGRHDTCGHTCTPSARAAVLSAMIFSCHGKPLTVSSAVHVSGRPMPRWRSYTSACRIFSPGRSAATPLFASRNGSKQRPQFVEVGDARRHRAAAVAVVRRRRRRRESGRARVQRVGDHVLHGCDLGVGRLAFVAGFAHDVQAHRGVPDVTRVVEQRAPLLDRVEVLREGLEALPRHTREQRVGRHVLDVLERAHE